MKWKIFPLLLMAALVFSLSACFGAGDAESLKIGICARQYEAADFAELEAAFTDAGYQPKIADAGNDQTKQTEQIGSFISEQYRLLVVEPVIVSAADSIVEQAKAADIPVVFVGYKPEDAVLEGWEKVCYIGSNTGQAGYLQGQILLQTQNMGDINGDGIVSYVIIGGPEEDLDAQAHIKTCTEALTAGGVETELLSSVCGDWTADSGNSLCAQTLAAYGKDIEVIFCGNDAMALGALEAVTEGGRTVGQDVYLIGIGGNADALSAISQGKLTGTVAADTQAKTERVFAAVKTLLEGGTVEKCSYVDYVAVTQENADTLSN